MEPSSIYHSNKRNLVIFSGLLTLVTLGSIEIVKSDGKLPFVIKNPTIVQHILFAAVLYCLYQFILSWFYQRDEIRSKFRYDFVVMVLISLIAAAVYIFPHLPPIASFSSALPWLNSSWLGALFGLAGFAFSVYAFTEAARRSRTTFAIRRETLLTRLLQPGWVLIFNPHIADPRLNQKSISFNSDGSIGDGRNNNEYTWRLDNILLAIFRSNGDLQNRFSYDERSDRFLCTNDSDAKGFRDQVILRQDQITP